MRRFVFAAFGLSMFAACQPVTTELTDEQKVAVEAELRAMVEEMTASIVELDIEDFLRYYENSEDLTVTMGGDVIRFWTTWANQVRTGMSPIVSMERCDTHDEVVQVLAADVAVYTADFLCSGTVAPDGPTMPLIDHTVTCVVVKRDGEWKIVNFSETLPQTAQQG